MSFYIIAICLSCKWRCEYPLDAKARPPEACPMCGSNKVMVSRPFQRGASNGGGMKNGTLPCVRCGGVKEHWWACEHYDKESAYAELLHLRTRLAESKAKVAELEREVKEGEELREAVKKAGELLTRPFVDGRYDQWAVIGKADCDGHPINEGGYFRQEAKKWVAKHWNVAVRRARQDESGENTDVK